MSTIGKGSLSLRKRDDVSQKSLGVGISNATFAHKAAGGETSINLSTLTTPPELLAKGFVQPSPGLLASLNIYNFRKNLSLYSSTRGYLIDYLSYSVSSNNLIRLDFELSVGEIIVGVVDNNPRNNLLVVDGEAIAASGELGLGNIDFNVGSPFEIFKYPTQQIGAVKVYRQGLLQARCVGNDLLNVGDYIEVPVPGGLGTLIRFKVAGAASDFVVVTSNGAQFERPTQSMLANIENLGGQVDRIVEVLASETGQPLSFFQVAPNSVDLKQFGDRVFGIEEDIEELKDGANRIFRVDTPNGHGAINTAIRFFTNVTQAAPFVTFGGDANTGSTFTINETGLYFIKYRARRNVDGNLFVWGLSRNSNQLTTDVNAITESHRLAGSVANGPDQLIYVSDTVWLNAGDIVRAHDTGVLANQPTENNTNNSLSITQMVRA